MYTCTCTSRHTVENQVHCTTSAQFTAYVQCTYMLYVYVHTCCMYMHVHTCPWVGGCKILWGFLLPLCAALIHNIHIHVHVYTYLETTGSKFLSLNQWKDSSVKYCFWLLAYVKLQKHQINFRSTRFAWPCCTYIRPVYSPYRRSKHGSREHLQMTICSLKLSEKFRALNQTVISILGLGLYGKRWFQYFMGQPLHVNILPAPRLWT